jgi:hypothetical protein
MASGIFYPSVSGDDGHVFAGFDTSLDYMNLGNAASAQCTVLVRFRNVTIPQGSLITSAFLRVTAYANNINPGYAYLQFNDIDDAVMPVDETAVTALDTTSNVSWPVLINWVDGTQYDTPDIASVLQIVVSRAGFASGNSVLLLAPNNNFIAGTYRRISSIDYLGGAEKAELHVEWVAPVAADETASWNPDDKGSNISLSIDLLTATHA